MPLYIKPNYSILAETKDWEIQRLWFSLMGPNLLERSLAQQAFFYLGCPPLLKSWADSPEFLELPYAIDFLNMTSLATFGYFTTRFYLLSADWCHFAGWVSPYLCDISWLNLSWACHTVTIYLGSWDWYEPVFCFTTWGILSLKLGLSPDLCHTALIWKWFGIWAFCLPLLCVFTLLGILSQSWSWALISGTPLANTSSSTLGPHIPCPHPPLTVGIVGHCPPPSEEYKISPSSSSDCSSFFICWYSPLF